MVKKSAKHVKSNHTQPQSSKTSVTMEEDKTSVTVDKETEFGNKKLLRHQEKIKREEEELKRLQAEKQEKSEAAERIKRTSRKKSKNPEKKQSLVKMTENIPVINNEETAEKLAETPSETSVEIDSPPIKTLFVRPGTDQEWVETVDTQLSEDWNELVKKDEEPMTDDQKIQKQTDVYDVQDGKPEFQSTENLNQCYEQGNDPSSDRESSYRGQHNQSQRGIGHLEYRRGGGGNSHNDNSRKKHDFGNHGDHSNFGQPRHNNKPYGGRGRSRGHDYQNYDQAPFNNESGNAECSSFDNKAARNDRPLSSNEFGNLERNATNKSYSRGGRGSRSNRPSSSNEYQENRHYDRRAPPNEVQNYDGHFNRSSRGERPPSNETQHLEGKQHESSRNNNQYQSFRERKNSDEGSINAPKQTNYNQGHRHNDNRRDSNQDDSSSYSSRPPSRVNNHKSNYRNQSFNKKITDEERNSARFNQNRRGNSNHSNRRGPNNNLQSFGDSNQMSTTKNDGTSNWSGSMAQSKQQATNEDWGSPRTVQQSNCPENDGNVKDYAQNLETTHSSNDWEKYNSSNWVNPNAPSFEESTLNASDTNAVPPEEAMDVTDYNMDESLEQPAHFDAPPKGKPSRGQNKKYNKTMDMSSSSTDDKDLYRNTVSFRSTKFSSRNDSASTPIRQDWRNGSDRKSGGDRKSDGDRKGGGHRNDSDRKSGDDRYDSDRKSGRNRHDSERRSGGDRRNGDGRHIMGPNKTKEFIEFWYSRTEKLCHGKLSEKIGNLFSAPKNFSLAHCVAADLSMGAGIAVHFRSEFRRVSELLNQNQTTGGLAVIKVDERFIYYLITKERSHHKPTYSSLWESLLKLKEHCVEHDVTNLAIPQIGCGLDRLDWNYVKNMLELIFRDVDIGIVVYMLKEAEESPRKPLKCFVTHTKMILRDIEAQTGLMYLGTEDAATTAEIDSLAEKHNFIHAYKSAQKTVGSVVKTIVGKEYIYGLIARETTKDTFNFVVLEKALRELRKILKQDVTAYIGVQAFKDDDSTLIVDKILSLMQYILNDVEIWVCWPPELEEYCPQ